MIVQMKSCLNAIPSVDPTTTGRATSVSSNFHPHPRGYILGPGPVLDLPHVHGCWLYIRITRSIIYLVYNGMRCDRSPELYGPDAD